MDLPSHGTTPAPVPSMRIGLRSMPRLRAAALCRSAVSKAVMACLRCQTVGVGSTRAGQR